MGKATEAASAVDEGDELLTSATYLPREGEALGKRLGKVGKLFKMLEGAGTCGVHGYRECRPWVI